MFQFIAVLPALWALYYANARSPQLALVDVYIPVLLFLPNYYSFDAPLIPAMNFNQAVIIAIMVIWLFRGASGWYNSFTDILVFGFGGSIIYSQLQVASLWDTQALGVQIIFSGIIPYVLAKSLIEPYRLRKRLAKHIVIVMLLVTLLNMYQVLTGSSLSIWQKVLGRFFGWGEGWRIQYRFGFVRAPGPYGHAILSGIIMVTGYRMQRWLEWSQSWPRRVSFLPVMPISLARLITIGTFFGALITFVRGPLAGGVIAAMIVAIGLFKRRWLIVGILSGLMLIAAPAVISKFIDYVSVDRRSGDVSENQQTAAYRWQLLQIYISVGAEKLWWGWGFLRWPTFDNQESIDNHFLLLFLNHGLVSLVCLLGSMFSIMLRLFWYEMNKPFMKPAGSSLGFTFIGIHFMYIFSLSTVYMGEQTMPLYFFLLGWSDAYLHHDPRLMKLSPAQAAKTSVQKTGQFCFRRVL